MLPYAFSLYSFTFDPVRYMCMMTQCNPENVSECHICFLSYDNLEFLYTGHGLKMFAVQGSNLLMSNHIIHLRTYLCVIVLINYNCN